MIQDVAIVDMPIAGEFDERIYTVDDHTSSIGWTYVKFTHADWSESCGVFRGDSGAAAVSIKRKEILVLTSSYLWRLDADNGNLIESEQNLLYRSLTVAPNGDFVLADNSEVSRIDGALKDLKSLASPIEMDRIKFLDWKGNKLRIECSDFRGNDTPVFLDLDASDWSINVK